MKLIKTAERVSHTDVSDNFVFQRSLLVYKMAANILSGKVLEIGTGSGYGIAEISPRVDEFWTIDKHQINVDYDKFQNTRFIKQKVPPLKNIPQNYFDFVICFQVIEHIDKDDEMLQEIKSVLKPGGKLIISTPNIEKSLTRNPWHVREYRIDEFGRYLRKQLLVVEQLGVFGDHSIENYYLKNKQSVNKILKYDLLKLNKKLPRWTLKIPYDIFNRINRKKLHQHNHSLSENISLDSYCLKPATSSCFDLVFIAEKKGIAVKYEIPKLATNLKRNKIKRELSVV